MSPSDTFAISQIGGIYSDGSTYDQATYQSQVSSTIAQGKYAHSYIWYQVGASISAAKSGLDYFLPRIQTPKGSIVALDYEAGATGDKEANTQAVIYGMQRVKDAGFTPMYYSYKPYTVANVNLSEILAKFPNSVWIAGYKDYNVTTEPDFNYFPSLDGVAQWQFTSTGKAGGTDYNVDLLGITKNGYSGTYKATSVNGSGVIANSVTPAVEQGQKANNTAKSDIEAGYTVKVNFSANTWANGSSIPSWVKGKSYKVAQVSGNKVLLAGILSWINKSNVEILQTSSQTVSNTSNSSSGTFNDGSYTVTREDGYFTPNQTLRVFSYPGINPTGARYYAGETIHYLGYVKEGNFIYVAYRASNGNIHYVAARQSGVALGTFK